MTFESEKTCGMLLQKNTQVLDSNTLFDYDFTLSDYLNMHPPADYLRELEADDPILTKQAFNV